jgi:hypothetical protein
VTERGEKGEGAGLELEYETYKKHKQVLLALVPDQFVLIKGDKVICAKENRSEITMMGHYLFPGEAFLVEEVLPEKRVYLVRRIKPPDSSV